MPAATQRGALVALLACSALTALLVPAAVARRLSWAEVAYDGQVPVLRFQVRSLTFATSGWSARVSLTNLSKRRIAVGDQFEVAIFAAAATTSLSKTAAFGFASGFSPKRPSSLAPGASWSGVIRGKGSLPASTAARYARLVFGSLTGVPGQKHAIVWVTNHALRLPGTPAGLAA
jgi:hypothetical protein